MKSKLLRCILVTILTLSIHANAYGNNGKQIVTRVKAKIGNTLKKMPLTKDFVAGAAAMLIVYTGYSSIVEDKHLTTFMGDTFVNDKVYTLHPTIPNAGKPVAILGEDSVIDLGSLRYATEQAAHEIMTQDDATDYSKDMIIQLQNALVSLHKDGITTIKLTDGDALIKTSDNNLLVITNEASKSRLGSLVNTMASVSIALFVGDTLLRVYTIADRRKKHRQADATD